MATVHITESELARDLHAVLRQVGQGVEVVVEQDNQPLAVIRSLHPRGRLLSECIAIAKARESNAILDSSILIEAERQRRNVAQFLEHVASVIGEREAALCSVGVAVLSHGVHRSLTP